MIELGGVTFVKRMIAEELSLRININPKNKVSEMSNEWKFKHLFEN